MLGDEIRSVVWILNTRLKRCRGVKLDKWCSNLQEVRAFWLAENLTFLVFLTWIYMLSCNFHCFCRTFWIVSKNCPLAALRWSWKSQRASLPTQIFQTYVTLLRHAYLRHCTCFYIFWYQAFWPLGVLNYSFIGCDLASHWEFLAAVLNTDKNGWWLGVIIATFLPLLQTVCACICTSVCAVLLTVLISLKELTHYLNCFGASWGAGQEKKPEYGKNPPLLVECQPIFLLCCWWLMAEANALQTLKIWPTPDWNHGGFFTVFELDTIS